LLCCLKGLFIAIEVKEKGGKLSAIQKRNLDRIARAGGIAIVATEVEEVMSAIEGVLCRKK
jgi:hypothetical protein